MATVTEEVAAAAVGAGEAPEKVAEVKEAASVEAKAEEEGDAKKVEQGEGETKKAEVEGEGEKAKKERKPRARKPRSAGPHHPPYFEMIKEAIMALDGNGKAGSSPYAIAKYMGERHKEVLPANYRKVLAVQLRNFAAKGRLVKVKASFKLSTAEEKKAAAAASKKRRAMPSAKKEPKKAAPARPARAKRAKKAAPAPAKPKQPKSIRTGVVKKAKKAGA